jgi:HCOMODA/2-hydroxy-3-carboxy-muconic semialdehyde decarboxylase
MTATKTVTHTRLRELVLANHILALEGVLDAYGHVSVRNPNDPNTFLMSRSRSPEIVDEDDILVHDFTGNVEGVAAKELYRERFIHAAIFAARPAVQAVIHSHADDVLPFSISNLPFQAVSHGASQVGSQPAPVWDIRTEFGDTNLLVENMAQGDSLSRAMDDRTIVLMRGHGFAAAGATLINLLKMATSLPRNARVILDVLQAGGTLTPLSAGEVALRDQTDMTTPAAQRQWEFWCRRLGVAFEPGGYL